MGSVRFEGVRFAVWSHDHQPPHVHAEYAGVRIVIELQGNVEVSVLPRRNSIEPANAARSDVRRILRVAKMYRAELTSLWEERHGSAY